MAQQMFYFHSTVMFQGKNQKLLEASPPCLYIYKIEIHTVELTGRAK